MYNTTKHRLTHTSKRIPSKSNVSFNRIKEELDNESWLLDCKFRETVYLPHNTKSIFLMYMATVMPNNMHICMRENLTSRWCLCILQKEIKVTLSLEGYNRGPHSLYLQREAIQDKAGNCLVRAKWLHQDGSGYEYWCYVMKGMSFRVRKAFVLVPALMSGWPYMTPSPS